MMQNNGAMKIVNFTHAQMAETSILSTVAPLFAMNAGYEASLYLCLLQILTNNQGWTVIGEINMVNLNTSTNI